MRAFVRLGDKFMVTGSRGRSGLDRFISTPAKWKKRRRRTKKRKRRRRRRRRKKGSKMKKNP